MNPGILWWSLLALAAPSTDERAVTTWLSQAAATLPSSEVVSSDDVQQLLALQGEKQVAGCDDDSDVCAAEVASALGAEVVVRAELGALDGQRTLAVTVLNTTKLGATKRALWQGSTMAALGDQVRAELPGLIASARSGTGPLRVFITDVAAAGDAVVDEPMAWQVPVGGGLVGVGVIGVGVAVVVEALVASATQSLEATGADRLDQLEAREVFEARAGQATVGQVAWAVGAIGLIAGGAVLATLAAGE